MVNEQVFNLPEVTPLLLLALEKLMLQSLDVWFHFVTLQYTDIVDPSLTIKFPNLCIKELNIIIKVDSLIMCKQLWW